MKNTIFILVSMLFLWNSDVNYIGLSMADSNNQQAKTNNPKLIDKPLIGLSAGNTAKGSSIMNQTYSQAIINAGGLPIIIPVTTNKDIIKTITSQIDGLILTGGEDINPSYYKEPILANADVVIDSLRDIYELELARIAANLNIPILGICRGEQLLNVAFGGTLYQDINIQNSQTIQHKQSSTLNQTSHNIKIVQNSIFSLILGTSDSIAVNSSHHQAVKKLAPIFSASAFSLDGIIEAIEAYPEKQIVGVQWHPEQMKDDTTMQKLFKFIVSRACLYKKAKEIHQRIYTIDTHADTPLNMIRKGINIRDRHDDEVSQIDIPKMQEGMLDGVFFAAYMAQGARDVTSSERAVNHITDIINTIHKQANENKDICEIAYTSNDLKRLKQEGKKAIFIGIENGYGIGKDLKNLSKYKKLGVNYITLTHTYDNDICDASSHTQHEWNGLSPYGREVVKEMNRLGIIVDVSHISEKSFYDILAMTSIPVIASHSSVKALCNHDRNLTNNQLKAIARNGGVVQICLVDIFINKNKSKASLDDAIKHIEYAVKVAGIDHVGIASDFDGGGGLIGCRGANDMINITIKLLEKGYTEEEISKIWGGNLLRVLDKVQNSSE